MSDTVNHNNTPDLALKGSELCVACGLCCQGVLHHHAVLKSEEKELAQDLGLPIYLEHDDEEADDYHAFYLPCPCYKDHRCSVYDKRPSPCRGYQCQLLKKYRQGERTFDLSLELIRIAKKLVADIETQLALTNSHQRLWRQIEACLEQQSTALDDSLRADIKALWSFCYYQFDPRISGSKFPLGHW